MKVKEFLNVINFDLLDYARIYEGKYNSDYEDWVFKDTGRIHNRNNLTQYLDCELDSFRYETQYGEYDDSAIYIKIEK